ncbi:MAG: endonuclease [Bacteroidaceae bacterium]|nr:endonuclease [Bacteroidaceae bacterium]
MATLCLGVLQSYAEIPPGYYDYAMGKKKAALKNAMHEIIKTANTLKYGSGAGSTWEGFYKTDRYDDNRVVDRYSYKVFYFPSNCNSAPSGMNVEHSFPKSWWGGGSNQAYKDIHHLMPSESDINSKKSNYPMGVVLEDKNGNGCTKVGKGTYGGTATTNLWEPADEWKGDFARAYFYMVTCYSNYTWQGEEALKQLENNDWPTLKKWTYDLLLQWNREDPVSDFERIRNDKVYAIQGNRNPFIDYGDLAEYIWGSKIEEAWNSEGAIIDPDEPGTDPTPGDTDDLPSESFQDSFGTFTAVTHDGSANSSVWTVNTQYKCAVANAFNVGKVADDYLISPVIDLTNYKSASLAFDHATGYNKANDASNKFSVVVTADADAAIVPDNVSWQKMTVSNWPAQASSNFTAFKNSGDIDLTAFCGKKIRVAFRYESTSDACWAWEVRDVKMTGEKEQTTLISELWNTSSISPNQKVYTINGVFLGNTIPQSSGLYIVKTKNKTIKVKH